MEAEERQSELMETGKRRPTKLLGPGAWGRLALRQAEAEAAVGGAGVQLRHQHSRGSGAVQGGTIRRWSA